MKTTISALFIIACIALVLSFPVMLLWNGCLVGAIDGVREIGWLQTLGLMMLCNVLFKTKLLA